MNTTFILLTDDRVDLPVAKLGAKAHDLGAFFDAPTEIFLVLTGFFRLGVTSELFGQIDVLDGKQTQIHIVVEGFGANHFFTAKLAACKSFAITGIKRPLVLTLEMLDNILKKSY